jgi:hypothetical protein
MNKNIELLKEGHAGVLLLNDGTMTNYGVISILHDRVIYYNGKGLREIWNQNLTEKDREKAEQLKCLDKEELIDLGYVVITLFEDILEVIN